MAEVALFLCFSLEEFRERAEDSNVAMRTETIFCFFKHFYFQKTATFYPFKRGNQKN